ncbi:MAG: hydroxyacid dehydrogenase [Candidatus Aenigmatarchaeota archaeon]|nr:MAG: hydroxyacid dehydrogenase [Candidatus Aenigmarchaeota archaeon]
MKVLITEKKHLHEDSIELLKKKGFELDFSEPDLSGVKLEDYDVLLIRTYTKVDKGVLNRAKKLKAVIRAGVGLDNIDVEECKKRDIRIYHSPGSNANAVASHTVALIFAVLRKIAKADKHVREGKWDREEFLSHELDDKVIGIVGFGAIGKLVAKKLSGFDVDFLAYDPYLTKEQIEDAEEAKRRVKKLDDLHELIRKSDIITIHVPLMPETRYIIGEKEFKIMKPHAILINTSRGGVVDEKALIEYLKKDKLYGAGLDVFEEEPPKNRELLELHNVVLTPHTAAMTEQAHRNMSVQAVESFLKDFKA